MTDPTDYTDDIDLEEADEESDERRSRKGSRLIAALILLLLLLFCVVTSTEIWVTNGPERARFIARNYECLQCHTELIPNFSKAAVHNPFMNKECTACHTPHGKKISVSVTEDAGQVWRRYTTALEWLPLRLWFSLFEGKSGRIGTTGDSKTAAGKSATFKGPDSELILPEKELCWMCHGDLGDKLDDMFQHQPFDAGRCTDCHDPHASDYSALLTQAPNKICLTCHPMGEELNRSQAHAPAASGWCIDCHDPHASDFKGVLAANQRELCFRCHPSVASMSGLPVQHAPFLNDDCSGCHEPHGSDYMPLLANPQPKLCYSCHTEIEDQFAQASHHPVGVALSCASCHDPHAAQYSGLLTAKDNSFCYECHGRIGVSYEPSAHKGQLCIECHTPHGSKYEPILRESQPYLCLNCHAASSYDDMNGGQVNHPVRSVYYDVNARKRLSCTSSCHNPHGTQNTFMLRFFDFPHDGNCLMCHAVTPRNRVAIDF